MAEARPSPSPLMEALTGPTARYIASRCFTTLFVLFGATLLLFAMTAFIPGNPAEILLGPRATAEDKEAFIRAMGLDRPLWEQVVIFIGNVLQGDLGRDIITGRPILDQVADVFPYTLILTFSAIGMAVLIGVPLGCWAAINNGGRVDQAIAVTSVSFIATPNFVVALFLLLIFATWLNWFPVLGTGVGDTFWEALQRLFLPALSLALGWIGYIARLLRASLLEVMGEAHVRTLRAYGVPQHKIIFKYALKLAAIPTVAILGPGIGRLMGGAIFAEIIFARPGIGTLIFDAINTRNYPVVQASVLIVVAVFTITNLIVDLLYLWLDPRTARRLKPGGAA